VGHYSDYAHTKPLQHADHDVQLLQALIKNGSLGKFDSRDITALKDSEAGLNDVELALKRTLGNAGPRDTVFIFISARGIARPKAGDGYLGNVDLSEQKPESTGVPISHIAEYIKFSRSPLVVIAADVCRDPPSLVIENQINFRIQELGTSKNVIGVLASEKDRRSFESDELASNGVKGFGFFTHVFGEFLQTTGAYGRGVAQTDSWDQFSAKVRDRVLQISRDKKQSPSEFGNPHLRTSPAWRNVQAAWPPRGPILLAARLWMPGMLAQAATAGATPDPNQTFDSKALEDPEALGRGIGDSRSRFTDEDGWLAFRDRGIAALAGQGQRIIGAYGVGDFLPEDPRKLKEDDFRMAARSLRAAIQLLPSDDTSIYRRSLEARALFCEGRAEAFRSGRLSAARDLLIQARNVVAPPIPEIDNALGVTYLNEGKDYDAAIRYFRLAIERSPAWAYPRHNLALALAEKGDYRAATDMYRQAIAVLQPESYLHYNLGLLLHRTNSKDAARAEYLQALKVLRERADLHRAVATAWQDTFPEDSHSASDRAAAFERSAADVHNALAALLESRGRRKEAAAEYRAAFDIDKNLCPARHNLAVLYETPWMRRAVPDAESQAQSLYEENLSRCGERFYPSLLKLGIIYLNAGKLRESAQLLQAVRKAAPGDVEAVQGLARVALAENRVNDAIGLLEDAITRDTARQGHTASAKTGEVLAHPALYESLGRAMENWDKARACQQFQLAVRALTGTVYTGDVKALRRRAKACGQLNAPPRAR
jgi:tetratricopeptide (TPR) repeat protein